MNRLLTVGCVGLVFACASMGGLAEETGVVTSRTALAVGQEASSSVLDGVFTSAQALRGGGLYNENCASCHGQDFMGDEMAPSIAGNDFIVFWTEVPVGMLFDPKVLIEQPGPVLATVAIIVIGKSVAAYALVRAFGHNSGTALTVSVSLAQIGEFSFILAGLGVGLKVLPETGRDLILAGSLLSILFNPILFSLAVKRMRSEKSEEAQAEGPDAPAPCNAGVVLIGYGRVGSHIGSLICGRGEGLTVIEDQKDMAAAAREAGATVIVGDATKESILRQAGLEVETVWRISEGRQPDILGFMRSGDVDLVVNLPTGRRAQTDGAQMRRLAVELGIPFITTITGARAAVEAIAEPDEGDVKPLGQSPA